MDTPAVFIDSLWRGASSLRDVYRLISGEITNISPAVAGIIGRELLLRIEKASTPKIALAAYLASDGEAGNDSLIDFIDCVAILPQARFERIISNPDSLLNDPVSVEFDEYGFYALFEKRFESAFAECDEGLLLYLVKGDTPAPNTAFNADEINAAVELPGLFQKYGKILKPDSESRGESGKVATLDDFFNS